MSLESWDEIEELFFEGLHASDTARQRLLSDGLDPQVVAAVSQLWADAAKAPANFLHDPPTPEPFNAYQVGDLVERRFRLQTLLGTGGMGQVFAAVDTRLDRQVALKFLSPGFAKHPLMRALLEREARAICRLADHPNICTVHDLYWGGEHPFLLMELLVGETLAARLARGPLPVADAVAIGLSIVDGLAHAHARDVIHRDVKPGNVMLTPFGPKLFDFGIAKRVEPSLRGDVSILAPPGAFVGSVSYTSPEQAEGTAIDARSDIFSVGCVLYEMVTAAKAFDGASRLSVLSAVLRAEPTPIRDVNPAVPLEYTRVVARCLQKQPSQRYQRTTDLRDVLDRLARSGFDWPENGQERLLSRAASGFSPDPGPDAGAAPDGARGARHGAHGLLARGSTHPIAVALSVTYGVMVGLALLVEIAYEWPAFGSWALRVAAVTCLGSIAVSLGAVALLRRRVANQQPRALLLTLAVFVGWSVALALAIGPQLPDRPLVRATFQTMTANVGYPKSLLEALTLPTLALVPLQVVCALEAELRRGRANSVVRVLASDRQAPSLPGTVVVRPAAASIVFGTVSIWWMNANARLLESLQSGPYYSLFLELGIVRVASGLLMLFAVLGWYTWTLNDLRQQAQEQTGG